MGDSIRSVNVYMRNNRGIFEGMALISEWMEMCTQNEWMHKLTHSITKWFIDELINQLINTVNNKQVHK